MAGLGSAMSRLLLDLDDDALARVLGFLEDDADWVFIALSCRALRRAALRAFEQAQVDRLRAAGLPGVVGNALVVAGPHPTLRVSTSAASIMQSPTRFAFAKQTLGFPNHFHEYALAWETPPTSPEFYAARNLSNRALYHMLNKAPLSMIRGSYFDVLSGLPSCRFVPEYRHHEALLTFAAYFGRVDVLDWLVHRNPSRAKAYDFDQGLLALLDVSTLAMMLGQHLPASNPSVPRHFSMLQEMLVRPAYRSDSVQTLVWIEATVIAIASRRGVRSPRSHPLNGPNHATGFFLGLSMLGRTPTEKNKLMWLSARQAVSDAVSAGAIHVLDCVFERTMVMYALAEAQYDRWQAYYVVFAVLYFVFHADPASRNGAALGWLIATCRKYALELTTLAVVNVIDAENGDHMFNLDLTALPEYDGCFDLKDLVFVFTSQHSVFNSAGTRALLGPTTTGLRNLEQLLLLPGDLAHNQWLLQSLANPCEWVARSRARLFPGGSLGAAFPSDWTAMDWLCNRLLRGRQHIEKDLRQVAFPRAGPDRPSEHVFRSWLAEERPWLWHEGFVGPTRLEEGQAFVLGRWIEHCVGLSRGSIGREMVEWWRTLREMPVACLPVLEAVCAKTLAPSCAQRGKAKRIMSELLEEAITKLVRNARSIKTSPFVAPQHDVAHDALELTDAIMGNTLDLMVRTHRNHRRQDRTCALLLARLIAKHDVLPHADVHAMLGGDYPAPFGEELARAFGA